MEIFFGIVIGLIILSFAASIFVCTDSLYYNLSGQNSTDIASINREIDTLWNEYNNYLHLYFNTEDQELKCDYLFKMDNILLELHVEYKQSTDNSRITLNELINEL